MNEMPPPPVRQSAPAIVERHVIVRDLELPCRIGVWPHEKGKHQRVRINIDLTLRAEAAPVEDTLASVFSYDDIVAAVKTLIERGHINLVETLAERIADQCLDDGRVIGARVRVEKLDAVAEALSVGAEVNKSIGKV